MIRKKIVTTLSLLAFSLFMTDRIFFFQAGRLEKVASTLVYPAVLVANKIATYTQHIATKKKDYATLSQNYENLQEAYDKMLTDLIAVRATIQYDKEAREIIGFQSRYNMTDALLAKILVKNITADEHSIIINRGLRDHIKKDMVAIYKLQIIGRVVEVHDYYSKVILITDQSCKIAAYTNSTNATGIASGKNILNRCHLTYVSHLSAVQDNDLVFSSGQGMIFPEGFCLGKIINHELKDKELYHQIELEPLVDIASLNFCLLTDQSKISLF